MLNISDHGAIREIRLARPPVNALGPAMIEALLEEIAEAEKSSKAIILSGSPKIFSAGLDVPTLLELNAQQIDRFFRRFFELQQAIAASRAPIFAAITGHAPAGGAVLALFCDYRIMADGPFKIGLNETQVGLPLPRPIFNALRYAVGSKIAERMAVNGTLLSAPRALECGFVDELVPQNQVVELAHQRAQTMIALPQKAMHQTRMMARATLIEGFTHVNVEQICEAWFSDETQTAMKALVAGLKARQQS